jgi:translation initiation factor 2 beta subunit (eIF-2beta)/eIF-5
MKLKNIIIVQNKMDLVPREKAEIQLHQIQNFLKGTCAENAPIFPISAQLGIGIENVIKGMVAISSENNREKCTSFSKMFVARSFDINKPGETYENIVGGVIGGTVVRGSFSLGDRISLLPRYRLAKDQAPAIIKGKIVSLYSETTPLDIVSPGGLVAIGTDIDASLAKSDGLVGMTVVKEGEENSLSIDTTINLFVNLLRRYVTTGEKIKELSKGEEILLNIGTNAILTTFIGKEEDKYTFKTLRPGQEICYDETSISTLSRKIDKKWRMIGWGSVAKNTDDTEDCPINFSMELWNVCIEKFYDSYSEMQVYSKLNLPVLSAKPGGSKRTMFLNFNELAQKIKRERGHIQEFICSELKTTSSIDDDGTMIIKGKFKDAVYITTVKKYLSLYVICKACKLFDTCLEKDNRILFVKCNRCGSKSSVDKTKL